MKLLLVPACPHADAARALLEHCLAEMGLGVEVAERVGAYPSPTICVDGMDVMTGAPVPVGVSACRLDIPTADKVCQALLSVAPSGDQVGASVSPTWSPIRVGFLSN